MAFVNTETLRSLELGTFSWMASQALAQAGILADKVDEDYLQAVMQLVQPKVNGLDTLADYVGYFFNDTFVYDEKVTERLKKKGNLVELLEQAKAALESAENWTEGDIDAACHTLAQAHGQEKPFAWFPAIRWAVSGVGGGPDLLPLLQVMGREKVTQRLAKGIELSR